MSKEAAIAFLKKVAEDPTLQQKLVTFAREQGYQFSVEELTDDQLGGVTGGALNAYWKLDVAAKLGTDKLDKFDGITPQLDESISRMSKF